MKMPSVALLLASTLSLYAGDKRLASVKKICIGTIADIGAGDDGEFSRKAVRFELTKNGFAVVDSDEAADAVLNVAGWSAWPNPVVWSSAVLKTPDGESIWEKEFHGRNAIGRAQTMAKKLRKDVAVALKNR